MGRDLSGVLDAVLAGIVVIDVDGRIEHINSAACQMLDTSAETALHMPLENLFPPQHTVIKMTVDLSGALRWCRAATPR